MIAAVRAIEGMPEKVADRAAQRLQEATTATASAGKAPDGAAWAPKKCGGGPPMANAASHVRTRAIGPTVRQTLTGPDVFHQYGVRGEPRRQVIPDAGAGLPKEAGDVVGRAAGEVWDEIMGGRR